MSLLKNAVELKKIGLGFIDNERYQQAIDFLTQSINMNDTDAECYDLRGVAYYRILKLEHAVADLGKAIEIDPEYYVAHAHLGEIAWAKQNWQEAERHYGQALIFNEHSLDYLSFLAMAKYKLKKTDEAETLCNSILDIVPNDRWTLALLGDIYIDRKMYRDALNCFVNLSEQDKDNFLYYQYIGYIYTEMGILDLARKNLEIAIHLNPDHAYPYNNLGYVYFKEKNYQEALRLVNQSLGMDASNSFAYRNRALIRIDKRESELAREDLLTAKLLGFEELYGSEVDVLLTQMQ